MRGELFVKFIRAHSHWAERASVLRIVMLALDGLRREGVSLPDFEFVYAHNDKDPTPDSFPKCHPTRRRRRGKTRGAEPSEPPCVGAPIPLFTNGRAVRHGDGAIGAGGLPLPDFTWVGWREQLPWCQLSAQLQSEAARHGQWSGRDARAIFSGGLDNGRDRKELRRLVRQRSVEAQRLSHTCTAPRASPAAWLLGPGPPCVGGIADHWARLYREQERRGHSSPACFPSACFPLGMQARQLLRVRDTEAGKWHRWAQFDRTNRTGAVAAKRPPLPLSSACAHRVALSLSGFGYSSRLRALLMCGATVVHVRGEDEEFFMPALVPVRVRVSPNPNPG